MPIFLERGAVGYRYETIERLLVIIFKSFAVETQGSRELGSKPLPQRSNCTNPKQGHERSEDLAAYRTPSRVR